MGVSPGGSPLVIRLGGVVVTSYKSGQDTSLNVFIMVPSVAKLDFTMLQAFLLAHLEIYRFPMLGASV